MSSTNVHSNKKNKAIVCGQTIADEKGAIQIPPTAAVEGPSILDVRQGIAMEITVGDGELHRDGTVTSLKDGAKVASYDKEVFEAAERKIKEKNAAKGNDR